MLNLLSCFSTASEKMIGVGLLTLGTVFMRGTAYLKGLVYWAESLVLLRYSAMVKRIYLSKSQFFNHTEIVPSISFMGGGQLWVFGLGVGHYVYENYIIGKGKIKFFASSCGCFSAVPLACGLDPYEWCHQDWKKCMDHYQERGGMLGLSVGGLFDSKHFYYDLWDGYLPEDAHIRCTDCLYISVTKYPSMENVVVSKFETRAGLIWTIIASTCLPLVFIADYPIFVPGVGDCIDGSITNDASCLDSYTITVSALHDDADITPRMVNRTDSIKDPEYWRNPITFIDSLVAPTFERVWQVGELGEISASKCQHFNRNEWKLQRKQVEVPAFSNLEEENSIVLNLPRFGSVPNSKSLSNIMDLIFKTK